MQFAMILYSHTIDRQKVWPKKSESRSLYVIDFLYAVLLELGTGGGDEEQ